MTRILLEYDESVDAAYLRVSDSPWHHRERLDDARGVNYGADGSVIGIEILSPRRRGVRLDGLPYSDDVARVMRAVSFRVLQNGSAAEQQAAVYNRLVQAAGAGELVEYGELAQELGIDTRKGQHWVAQIVNLLDRIDEGEVPAGRPMLSAIVVRKDTRLPGSGFRKLGMRLGQTELSEGEKEFASRQMIRTHAYWRNAPSTSNG